MGWKAERKEQKRYLSPGQYLMVQDCAELWGSVWPWLHVHPTTRYVLLLLFPLPTMLFHEHVVCVTLVLTCAVYLQGQCRKDKKKWQRKGKEMEGERQPIPAAGTLPECMWENELLLQLWLSPAARQLTARVQIQESKLEKWGDVYVCSCGFLMLSTPNICEISDYSFLTVKAISLCISIVFM